MLKPFFAAITILLISGCSSKQMYKFGQDYQKSDCSLNVISLEQYDECMRNNQVPFEDYQNEREAIIKQVSNQ